MRTQGDKWKTLLILKDIEDWIASKDIQFIRRGIYLSLERWQKYRLCLRMSLSEGPFSDPPVLLALTTALRTSWIASVTSRAQRALPANQGSRPLMTICPPNYGPFHSSSLLAVWKMFAPSCRLAEQPLLTIDCITVPISSVDPSAALIAIFNGLYNFFSDNITFAIGLFFYILVSPVG